MPPTARWAVDETLVHVFQKSYREQLRTFVLTDRRGQKDVRLWLYRRRRGAYVPERHILTFRCWHLADVEEMLRVLRDALPADQVARRKPAAWRALAPSGRLCAAVDERDPAA